MDFLSKREFSTLTDWYRLSCENTDLDVYLIFYVKTSPGIANEGVKFRNRPEERDLTLEEHENLGALHDLRLLRDTFKIDSWLDLQTWWKKPCENHFLDETFRYMGETLILNGDRAEDLILNEYREVKKMD